MNAPAASLNRETVTAQGTARRTVAVALLGALLLFAYRATLHWLTQRYSAPDSYYGHGPLIPLIGGYLVLRHRHRLAERVGSGSWWGLLIVLPSAFLHFVGLLLRIDFLSGLSLWTMLAGLVVLLGGSGLFKRIWFAWLFLGFALPLPLFAVSNLVLVLKQWVLRATALLLSTVGVDVKTEGSFLVLPDGNRLLIEEECCGLRSLIALIALGVLIAGTSRRLSTMRRWCLVALAPLLAVLANLLRVLALGLVAVWFGAGAAHRIHDPSTYLVYAVAIGFYVTLERILETRGVPLAEAPP